MGSVRVRTIFSQSEFAKDARYLSWDEGVAELSYNDSTHIKDGEWWKLLKIQFNGRSEAGSERECSFSLQLDLDKNVVLQQVDKKEVADKKAKNANAIADAVSLSLTRAGILSPEITGETAAQLLDLRRSKGIVLIPDTNSLYNGTLHWLLQVLRPTSVWLMPFVMSLTQMQAREATLKGFARSQKEGNLPQALRSRALVNAGLSFLERNRHRYQVLELDPSLLRYMRAAGKGGFDQDEGDILEDRLLIEGVHSVLRSTRTRATQLVVTSDVLLSRMLGAEGIANICLPAPRLGPEPVLSFRYDAWAGAFVGSSLRSLLWDMTHAFSSIKLAGKSHSTVKLSCYWPGKLSQNWVAEHLDVADEAGDAIDASELSAADSKKAKKVVAPSQAPVEPSPAKKFDNAEPSFSEAPIPHSSLHLALRLAGALYEAGNLTFAKLMEKLGRNGSAPNEGNVRRSLEVIRRAQLLGFDGKIITARPELDVMESCLQRGDLDQISSLFESFKPYKVVQDYLRLQGGLTREEIRPLLTDALERAEVPVETSIRLVRYHILLGQCWTDGAIWRCGSFRPNMSEFIKQFEAAYESSAKDNIAQVAEFQPVFCRAARMSPWSVSRAVQNYASVLSEKFTFGYAVGSKPTGVDAVVAGSLLQVEEVPVPMDRFEIGGRPVFTLQRVR